MYARDVNFLETMKEKPSLLNTLKKKEFHFLGPSMELRNCLIHQYPEVSLFLIKFILLAN